MGTAVAAIIGAVVAGIASIVVAGITSSSNKQQVESTNQANAEAVESTNASNESIAQAANELNDAHFQQELEWNQYVQQQTWDREDTQYQRRVQDLQAAGISPLALSGTSYNSGAIVSAPSASPAAAIPSQAPQFMAHQFDASSLLGSLMSGSAQISDTFNKYEERMNTRAINSENADVSMKTTLWQIEAQSDMLQKQLEQARQIADQTNDTTRLKMANDFEVANNQLAELTRANMASESETNRANVRREQAEAMETFLASLRSQYGDQVGWHVVSDDDYDKFYADWVRKYDYFVTDLFHGSDSLPDSWSDSGSSGSSVSAGLGRSLAGDVNASSSTSQSRGRSESWQQQNAERIRKFWAVNPVPVKRSMLRVYGVNFDD